MTWFAQGTLADNTLISLKTAPSASHTIYVTKMTLSIKTHANTKKVYLQDDAATPVVIAEHVDLTAAAAVPSVVTWDFGRKGVSITTGKNLNCTGDSATGVAGIVYAEGYVVA